MHSSHVGTFRVGERFIVIYTSEEKVVGRCDTGQWFELPADQLESLDFPIAPAKDPRGRFALID